jgi:hypothetical protein
VLAAAFAEDFGLFAVPEPASCGLLVCGGLFVVVALRARRRRA